MKIQKAEPRKPLRLRLPNLNDPRIIEKYSKLFTPEGYEQMRRDHDAWNKRARRIQRQRKPRTKKGTVTEEDLYKLYASWTGQLHFWVAKHLNAQVNFEFFPAPDWKMAIYPGPLHEDSVGTVPLFIRPPNAVKLKLPTPEDLPTQEALDDAFRALCLATARVLGIRTGKAALPPSNAPIKAAGKSMLKHASLPNAPERDQPKNRKSDEPKRSRVLRLRKPGATRKRRSASTSQDRKHREKRAK